MEYVVVIHEAEEGGYWAEVPGLEGCFAQGETVDETIEDSKAAIASHLEALREMGETVPGADNVIIAKVTIPAA